MHQFIKCFQMECLIVPEFDLSDCHDVDENYPTKMHYLSTSFNQESNKKKLSCIVEYIISV